MKVKFVRLSVHQLVAGVLDQINAWNVIILNIMEPVYLIVVIYQG